MILDIGNRIVNLDAALLDMETKLRSDMEELKADRARLIRDRMEAHQAELAGINSEYDMMARIIADQVDRIAVARGAEPATQEFKEAAE